MACRKEHSIVFTSVLFAGTSPPSSTTALSLQALYERELSIQPCGTEGKKNHLFSVAHIQISDSVLLLFPAALPGNPSKRSQTAGMTTQANFQDKIPVCPVHFGRGCKSTRALFCLWYHGVLLKHPGLVQSSGTEFLENLAP